jgi:predicted ATP-dependent serine protease
MTYQCNDCSYKSTKGFSSGSCPGCGSFNIKSVRNIVYEPEKPKKTIAELVIMFALWGSIIFGMWDKYIR